MIKTTPVRDDAHWKELRAQHVGGSEIAALFGEHAQLTRWELWHVKKGLLPAADLSDNDRVFWGSILEPAIAQGIAAKTGWKIRKVRRYHSCLPDLGLGASLDFEIVAHDRGAGVLEIKTADWLVAKRWEDGSPPLAYELQLQSYMGCTGRKWGVMGVLVGGNDLRLFEYERRPKTIEIIRKEVAEFWRSIAENKPPKPDFARDSEAVVKLYSTVTEGKVVDLSGSNRLPELIADYLRGGAEEKSGKATREAARAEIFSVIGDAEVATCGSFRIAAGSVAAKPDRLITADMVGQTLKGKAGYRSIRITERKDAA